MASIHYVSMATRKPNVYSTKKWIAKKKKKESLKSLGILLHACLSLKIITTEIRKVE